MTAERNRQVHKVTLADDPRRLLRALVDRPMSREGCAELIGDPCASAAALSLLRDMRLVRYDRDDREWFATADGHRAAESAS